MDVLAAGCDAGIRYDERLEADMIAVPIGPRVQRFATAAAPAYLGGARHAGAPARPAGAQPASAAASPAGTCIPGSSSATATTVRLEPTGPLLVRVGEATDLAVTAAVAGTGVIQLFEDWLRPHLDTRRAAAGAGAVVAELPGAVPLLPRPPPGAAGAAGVPGLRAGWGGVGRKRFFFEKKKQKTFAPGTPTAPRVRCQTGQSLFASFSSEKEDPSCLKPPRPGDRGTGSPAP